MLSNIWKLIYFHKHICLFYFHEYHVCYYRLSLDRWMFKETNPHYPSENNFLSGRGRWTGPRMQTHTRTQKDNYKYFKKQNKSLIGQKHRRSTNEHKTRRSEREPSNNDRLGDRLSYGLMTGCWADWRLMEVDGWLEKHWKVTEG